MRRNLARALQKIDERVRCTAGVAAFLLLAGCSSPSQIGIWPEEPLPPAASGPPPAYPSFIAPADDPNAPQVLTNIERQDLEARMSRLAKDRGSGRPAPAQKSKEAP